MWGKLNRHVIIGYVAVFEIARNLPDYGVGSKIKRHTWLGEDCFWTITKIKPNTVRDPSKWCIKFEWNQFVSVSYKQQCSCHMFALIYVFCSMWKATVLPSYQNGRTARCCRPSWIFRGLWFCYALIIQLGAYPEFSVLTSFKSICTWISTSPSHVQILIALTCWQVRITSHHAELSVSSVWNRFTILISYCSLPISQPLSLINSSDI